MKSTTLTRTETNPNHRSVMQIYHSDQYGKI
jgi:hypothetical protein